jgi:predicted phosphodiesterase
MENEKKIYLPNNEVYIVEPESPIASKKITFDSPKGLEAEEWFEEAERRQKVRTETEDKYDYAKIELQSDRPVVVGITGDWHLGSEINLPMLKRDIQIMAEHPLVAGTILTGDLCEAANFNPAQDEQVLNWEEQRKWMEGMMDFIGKDRILAIFKSNHDHKWERKHGTSKYAGLSKKYEAPVFYGNSYIDLSVNDVNYRMMGSHTLRGNSIYSNTHPAVRGHREVQNLDLVFCGHTHRKGYTQQSVREFNGARKIYSVVTGTYQTGGEYAKDQGFGTQKEAEQGMWWLVFNHDQKLIRVLDTPQMLDTMGKYL